MKIVLVCLLVAILLAATNPTKDEFLDWAGRQFTHRSRNQLETLFREAFGRTTISMSTARQNYILFSTFLVNVPNEDPVYFLGVFKMFIPLSISVIVDYVRSGR